MLPDSTLSNYMKHALESNKHKEDTCYSGFYNVLFKLNKKGELADYDASLSLPSFYRDTIKMMLINLRNSWDKDFLAFVAAKNRLIVLPVNLWVNEGCTFLPTLKSTDTTQNSISEITEVQLLRIIKSLSETYVKSNKYTNPNNNKLSLDGMLLEPCIVNKKSLIKKAKM